MLKLPIQLFLKLYVDGIKTEAANYRELLEISMAPKMKFEYYEHLRAKYNRFIYPNGLELPEKPADMVIAASSPEAREVVFNVFKGIKRGFGYV